MVYDTQAAVICTLFYEKINMLLFVMTSFSRSLIFQDFLFMIARPIVVLISMSLKLLQIEQNLLINQIYYNKDIVLNGKNNIQNILIDIINKEYNTQVFISPKIALSMKFKSIILDQSYFINCIYLLVIDEIYVVEK